MNIAKEGYLNNFVKPVSEGGYGLPEWIVSQMTENRGYPHTEIYEKIQVSSLDASVKALSIEKVLEVCQWMRNKDFNGVTIVKDNGEKITYNQSEAFGMNNQINAEGTDNGNGTRTVTLDGWKPDGSQIRLGFKTVNYGDAYFSQINAIAGTFTGNKGEEYDLLISYLNPNNEWKTKEFRISFAV